MALVEPDTPTPDSADVDQLEADLITWAGHIAAATATWLVWLAAYDRARGWERWGCRSAAHWLSWKCGMSIGTARAHVRVARALEHLPVVANAFSAGELSFSKVRALTRLRRPFDEEALVEQARWATASQLDRLVSGCVRASGEPTPRRRYRTSTHPDGWTEIVVVVTADEAERIEQTLAAEIDRVIEERDQSVSRADWVEQLGGWDSLRADSAAALLTRSIEESGPAPVDVVVNIDAAEHEAPHELEGRMGPTGARLPDELTKMLSCDATIGTTELVPNADGAVGIGRRSRIVPWWLRRLLERRDLHTCRFPSCTSNRRLHAHHIIHWSDRGPTNLGNLVLLCRHHHRLVHEGGYRLTGGGDAPVFATPTGVELLARPMSGSPDQVGRTEPGGETLMAKGAGERLDLAYAVSVNLDAMASYRRQHAEPRGPSLN